MNNNHKVVYSGTLKAGVDTEQFIKSFMQVFKAPEAHARKLVSAGRVITLKDNLDHATAEKYRQIMDKLGMQVHVSVMTVEPPSLSGVLASSSSQAVAQTQQVKTSSDIAKCPKCGSERIKDDDCLACGIIISRYRERQTRLVAESNATAVQTTTTADDTSEPYSSLTESDEHWMARVIRNPFSWVVAVVALGIAVLVWRSADSARDSKEYGQNMVAEFDVSADVIKRFNDHTPSQPSKDKSFLENMVNAKTIEWSSQPIKIDSSKNPYTVVVTLAGRASSDGELSTTWLAGWGSEGVYTLKPLAGSSKTNVKAGDYVILTTKTGGFTFKHDQVTSAGLSFVKAINCDIKSVHVQVWSGVPETSTMEYFFAFVSLFVAVITLFLRWRLRA